jgi:hypothetical protein
MIVVIFITANAIMLIAATFFPALCFAGFAFTAVAGACLPADATA